MDARDLVLEAIIMKITIKSKTIVKQDTYDKIEAIFKESNCPNESLINSINEFTSYTNGVVYLGCEPEDENVFTYALEVGGRNDK